jgi:hypothetical protein
MRHILAIDPGNTQSGFVEVLNKEILFAGVLENQELMGRIMRDANTGTIVLYEDIKPYSVRLGQQTIDTCKFIGELDYRLKEAAIDRRAIFRWQVKQWVYDQYRKLSTERIMKKIELLKKKRIKEKNTKNIDSLKPHFIYVDDRIVLAAMKEHWKIQKPKPGKRSEHGLSAHSWQALAVATFFLETS